MATPELVNPAYYKDEPFESYELNRHLGYLLGTAAKYVYRAGKKDSEAKDRDLRKALWFVIKAEEEALQLRDMVAQMAESDDRRDLLLRIVDARYHIPGLRDLREILQNSVKPV